MNDHKCYETIGEKMQCLSLKNYELLENESGLFFFKKDNEGIIIYYNINNNDLIESGKIEIIRLSEDKLYSKNIPEQRMYTYIAQYTNEINNETKEITLNDAFFLFENLIKHFNLEELLKN
jgi:hypothetical protein